MLTPIHVKVEGNAPQHYSISLGHGLIQHLNVHIPADLHQHRIVIVTDQKVKKLYAHKVIEALGFLNQPISVISFREGETSKNAKTKSMIESALLKQQCGRDTCLIALGGGVVGDVTGFVASTYMRGIPYVHIPTTLLALIDSSIGGKTAINTREGKNLIGAFWHPRAVIGDLDCLTTLPEKHVNNGWIEALKIFLTSDTLYFKKFIDKDADTVHLIKKAIELKSQIVTRDPFEKHARTLLNFGHTIGHALERLTDYKMLHGQAVGYGMLLESTLALQQDLLSSQEHGMIVCALASLGIEGKALKKYPVSKILKMTEQDKKNKLQQVHYVLLKGIGHVLQSNGQYAHPVSHDAVIRAYDHVVKGASHAR